MFKDNSFATQYFQIISDAKTRGDQYKSRYLARKHLGYVEGHHIQPSSLDGPDTRENIVWLTAYEHLKCHLLLTEMCADEGSRHKMLLAVTRMVNKQDSRRDREKLLLQQITDEEIMWLAKIREDAAEAHSAHMKVKHAGEGNPFYGKTHTTESNDSRRAKLVGVPKPEGHGDKIRATRLQNSAYISALVTGTKNPRYNPTQYTWENIHTGETRVATRLEMTQMDPKMKPSISTVIKGKKDNSRGWRLK